MNTKNRNVRLQQRVLLLIVMERAEYLIKNETIKNKVETIKNTLNTSTRITKTPTQLSKHPHLHSPTLYRTC